MLLESKRKRSLSFLEKVEELEKKKIGVILENEQVPIELKEKGTCKFRPSINWGKNSKKNTLGEFKANKQLPKINKYINTIEWHWKQYNGRELEDMYDFRDIYRNVYQKEFIKPLEIDFIFVSEKNLIYADLELNELEKAKKKILLATNILLEKFGFCQILDEDFKEYIPNKGFKICNWAVLPEGEEIWDITGIRKYKAPTGREDRKRASFDSYRLNIIINKNPKEKYVGINGFQDYLVFLFEDVCILETGKYGNATYIINTKEWKHASSLTKKELLNSDYIINRIIHNEEWKRKIDTII